MMKKFSSTWLFGVLVIGFALYVYQFEYVAVEEQKEAEEQAKTILPVPAERVSKVELIFADDSTLLEKDKEQWFLKKPVDDLADSSETDDLLKTLTQEKGEFVVEGEEVDLEEFGLVSPKGEIRVQYTGGEKLISIGTVTSYDGESYIKASDSSRVLLVKPVFADLIEKPIKDLRDKRVLRDPVVPETLEIRFQKKTTRLVKADQEWKIAGESTLASPTKVASFFADINSLEASNFVSEEKSSEKLREFGLDLPALTLLSKEKDGREVKVDFSRDLKGKRFVAIGDRDVILEIAGYKFDEFNRTADHFKDRARPFQFDAKDVQGITISHPDLKLELKKEEQIWRASGQSDAQKLDQTQVNKVIQSLGALRVDHFLGDKKLNKLSDSNKFVILTSSQGKTLFELRWEGPFEKDSVKKEKIYWVRTNLSHEVLALPVSKLDGLSFSNILVEKKKEEVDPDKKEKQ